MRPQIYEKKRQIFILSLDIYIKDKVSCLLDVSSGEIFMLAYICLSIVCSASLFIAFGTVVPSQWQRCAIRVAGPCHRSGTVLPL